MCYTWYAEVAPGVGTTLIQVGQAQFGWIRESLLAPLPSRGYVENSIDQQGFWLIFFQQVSFLLANAASSKMEVLCKFACPFWWQIGEDNLYLSSAHNYCLSCAKAMLKSMLSPVHGQDLNLHFATLPASFLTACIFCKVATLSFFHKKSCICLAWVARAWGALLFKYLRGS